MDALIIFIRAANPIMSEQSKLCSGLSVDRNNTLKFIIMLLGSAGLKIPNNCLGMKKDGLVVQNFNTGVG